MLFVTKKSKPMKIEFLNLLVALVVALCYLFVTIKLLTPFFYQFSKPMTNATGLLFFGVILGFGICLNDFSAISTNALIYYSTQGTVLLGIGYYLLFAFISLVFSYVLFRLSFFVIDFATNENEKVELAKNNFIIAGIHAVVFNILCLVLSHSVSIWANTFMNYPNFPD
jgi:hypothetical protein